MTAQGITIAALAFPDPDTHSINTADFQAVNSSLSYHFTQLNKIVALSVADTLPGNDIDGLLYTPVIKTTSACNPTPYLPSGPNQSIIPNRNIGYVALAPWINSNCTLSYFDEVVTDPIRAFLVYLPGNSSDVPPGGDNSAWDLGDGGAWRKNYKFPVYGIPSTTGQELIKQIAMYVGNITSVPNGKEIAALYPNANYVQLAIDIDLVGGPTIPGLWVFLLIVLGILLLIISITSISMHLIQRSRRNRLRDRIANGEVNLEALGIKRLTVPDSVLARMPLYTYTARTPGPTSPPLMSPLKEFFSSTTEKDEKPSKGDRVSAATTTTIGTGSSINNYISDQHTSRQKYSQPTCAICLDDFVADESTVRELPCAHIFHPECIDLFLKENSSLCPMCKKSTLPKGYCPAQVTNGMVRRERMMRRLRGSTAQDDVELGNYGHEESRLNGMLGWIPGFNGGSRRDHALPRTIVPAPARLPRPDAASSVEMQTPNALSSSTSVRRPTPARINTNGSTNSTRRPDTMSPPIIIPANTPPQDVVALARQENINQRQLEAAAGPPEGTAAGSEWAHQRAIAMINTGVADGPRSVSAEVEEAERRRNNRPGWRKAVGRVFPSNA